MMNVNMQKILVYVFLAIIVGVVFQQIYTSMTEQGIASGGPYNNGAAYPRAIAIAIALLVAGQILIDSFKANTRAPAESENEKIGFSDLRRPLLLLIVFAIFLGLLDVVGYHLATTPLLLSIMLICGARDLIKLLIVALVMSFSFAFIFENFLNVVLPGGILNLNIAW